MISHIYDYNYNDVFLERVSLLNTFDIGKKEWILYYYIDDNTMMFYDGIGFSKDKALLMRIMTLEIKGVSLKPNYKDLRYRYVNNNFTNQFPNVQLIL